MAILNVIFKMAVTCFNKMELQHRVLLNGFHPAKCISKWQDGEDDVEV